MRFITLLLASLVFTACGEDYWGSPEEQEAVEEKEDSAERVSKEATTRSKRARYSTACRKDGKTVRVRVTNYPNAKSPELLCTIESGERSWRAVNERDFCDKKSESEVARYKAEGYNCSS